MPSPQISTQVPEDQSNPTSIVQVEEHPSPSTVFPSSHSSVVETAIIPFPQVSKYQLLSVVFSK